ncbi:MAG: glycosyltransferase family 4 protein [Symploca sp. SIO3C6]|uniref:Glycosyltransferase family 4 protein n=1 Tax=Symploca sp. SIO1C4 TaxID=2607765 RepID=A0A6B3N5T7_9CYAN|nr:glycosyltransferase family 4 protein [Symploca sp. SIO3C6]NER26927.1 glycosyltransferase family 4 protein [Symploca sp. SIO1C4]
MSNPRILVAQLGARRHYQQPILFHQWGILERLYTDFYSGNNGVSKLLRQPQIYKHLPNALKKTLDRYAPALEKVQIIHFPWFGYQFAQALKKCSPQELSSIFLWTGKEFCKRIIQNGLGDANIVYGFNGASLELFEYAKTQGIYCILDQTLAERSFAHQLLLEEENNWQWWSSSPFTVDDSILELVQREQCEQDLADHIICGSNFVKNSLITRGVSANKISVVALGISKDNQAFNCKLNRRTLKKRGDELRILFAGSVGLRKGIPYLLQALRLLKGKIPFTCKVAGSIDIKLQRVKEYSDVCNFLGRVPRSQMADLYTWADVFVLPSICEGSAMVIYEALNWGLPVITTYNSGSIVRDGIDGFIVPIRDAAAITDNLLKIYNGNYQINQSNNLDSYIEEYYQKSSQTFFDLLTKDYRLNSFKSLKH